MNNNISDTMKTLRSNYSESDEFKKELFRYLSFWPWFILSLLFFLTISFLYLRYAVYQYETIATIEIIDESQDSEMALPTSMTIFNRSMINLENETNILRSFSLHSTVVNDLSSNIKFYTQGQIKTSQDHPDEWIDDYELSFKLNVKEIKKRSKFVIELNNNNKVTIYHYDNNDDLVSSYDFEKFDTSIKSHELPFELKIYSIGDFSDRILVLDNPNIVTNTFRNSFQTSQLGKDSDQLLLKLRHQNKKIANQYLNSLLNAFDKDGVIDRQLEYKRTIEFVDNRSKILEKELEIIELNKQNFKKSNNLSDLKVDADNSITQKFTYDNELFVSKSQKSLAGFLLESMSEGEYDYLPINIGLENFDLNLIINDYNELVSERNKYLAEAGPNNFLVKSLESQLDNITDNIKESLTNFANSLDLQIKVLSDKEKEFEDIYGNVPENEKILRSIDRELTVKESLFLLMLQKREEAAINFAVVKPTIKVIDYSITNPIPISPNKRTVYVLSMFIGMFIPFSFLYLRFLLDTKIHTKDQLKALLNDNITVIGEIPYIVDEINLLTLDTKKDRSNLSESLRMTVANFNYSSLNNSKDSKIVLVTSSIKGEGKTIVSVNLSKILSDKFKKVLLIGADLRNPQLHKYLSVDKSVLGLSDYIFRDDLEWKKLLLKAHNLDVLLSGTIPPNPLDLLSSQKFDDFIKILKQEYDCIVIDSAPCLLVSDTFELSKYIDHTLYVVRASYTQKDVMKFVNENFDNKKLNNINIIFNSVGNSGKYGYRYGYQYGYQYGYKYGYKYGYNYGYGYGYSEDK